MQINLSKVEKFERRVFHSYIANKDKITFTNRHKIHNIKTALGLSSIYIWIKKGIVNPNV
jgi:hypothetical protein